MLVEISQMQRLMVFLGHPVYGLSVSCSTILLLSAAAGSTTVGAHVPRPGAVIARVAALLTTLGGSRVIDPPVHHLGAIRKRTENAHSGVGPAAGARRSAWE